MADPLSSLLLQALQVTGSNENTWGDVANANFQILEQAIAGLTTRAVSGVADVELTDAEERSSVLIFSGTLTGDQDVIVSGRTKKWTVSNETSGAYALTIKTESGSGVILPQSSFADIHCDGNDVFFVEIDQKIVTVSTTGGVTSDSDDDPGLGAADIILVSGTLTSDATIEVPLKHKTRIVKNETTGDYGVFVRKDGSGADGMEIFQGRHAILYGDEDAIVKATEELAVLAVAEITLEVGVNTIEVEDRFKKVLRLSGTIETDAIVDLYPRADEWIVENETEGDGNVLMRFAGQTPTVTVPKTLSGIVYGDGVTPRLAGFEGAQPGASDITVSDSGIYGMTFAEADALLVRVGGTITERKDITLPPRNGLWWIANNTSGSQAIRVGYDSQSLGSRPQIDAGYTMQLMGDGTNITSLSDTIKSVGDVVQVVSTKKSTIATSSVSIPFDNSIPQKDEGAQAFSRTITPVNENNELFITVEVSLSHNTNENLIVALFKDDDSDALKVSTSFVEDKMVGIFLKYEMTAGTIDEIDFKVRYGSASGITTLNGLSGASLFGGTLISSITITEIKG